jgi:hypothetical protein
MSGVNTSDCPSNVIATDCSRTRVVLRRRWNTDDGELIETDTWPANEKADLTSSMSTSEISDFNLAYDKSASPNNSKESEKGTMSIDTGMSRRQ